MFCKLLLSLCQLSDGDGPYPAVGPGGDRSPCALSCPLMLTHIYLVLGGTKYLSETILEILLSLLKKKVREHGHHSQQYFHFFLSVAMRGAKEVGVAINFFTLLKFDLIRTHARTHTSTHTHAYTPTHQ